MMMCLGMFVFSLSTLAYQEFLRQTEWKHASTARVGARDAHQFTGPGDDTLNLSGWFAPEFKGTPLAISILRGMADTGRPWILVEGTGHIYGHWLITSLSETRTNIEDNGAGGRIEFSLSLKCADDDVAGILAGARDTLNKYLPGDYQLPEVPSIPGLLGGARDTLNQYLPGDYQLPAASSIPGLSGLL